MANFVSLAAALEGWFDKSSGELPKRLRVLIEETFHLFSWDALSAEQRQFHAVHWDNNNDPALESERQRGWNLVVEKHDIKRKIRELELMATPTPTELESKDRQLAEQRRKLALNERQLRGAHSEQKVPAPSGSPGGYIAYPKAMAMLRDRLNATPDELAAWISDGPENGGLAAYRNANELDPPPRFYYGFSNGSADDFDYLSPLMGCWFVEEDIARFQPVEHYITGTALIERWSSRPDIQPEAFIRAKITESRLLDAHPIFGLTQGTNPEDPSSPPMAIALFAKSDVEAIEAEDFGEDDNSGVSSGNPCQAAPAWQIRHHFCVIQGLDASENEKWWKERMANANRYGLLECRVGAGKRGKGAISYWRPDMIAGWLVDRKGKGDTGLSADAARAALRNFPGCEQIADDLFPPDQ